jgi:single-stranded-DNA-specific exonuclease
MLEALQRQWRILIIGDYDADGATGTALAMRGLAALGFVHLDYLVPDRFRYGYGLSPAIVELALERRPELLVTVDNGISSIEGVALARTAGLRVLITDHHLPGPELPEADVILNPNLADNGFPSKALAGVGVVFYLLMGLRQHLRTLGYFNEQRPEPNLAALADLVALGTVADVVPLDQNNRILVQLGLNRIRQGLACPGIAALIKISKRAAERLQAADLGFAIGPRLNAAGRLEDMSLGIECLLSNDPEQAMQRASQLDQLNLERRSIEADMRQEAEAMLDWLPESSQDWPLGVCLKGENWHEGVIGILASRLKERLYRPVILFAPAENGDLKGSGRSVEGLHLRDTLEAMAQQNPGLIQRFGGHAMAAGLTIATGDFTDFALAFAAEVTKRFGGQAPEPVLWSDGPLATESLQLELAHSLRDAGPWGQGFAEPAFDGRFRVLQRRLVGEQHLKLLLSPLDRELPLDAIGFYMGELCDQLGDEVHLLYRLEVNHYQGQERLQLQILHLDT